MAVRSEEAEGADVVERREPPPAIETSRLARTFGSLRAVDGIDLCVERGELFSLLGPNGAGKTTAIKMLCYLLRPTGGSATIMGHDVSEDSGSVKRMISVSPQETAIAEHLNARENLRLMFSSAMILAKDRETALFSRLLTTPLTAREFVVAYSLPYLAVAVVQGVVVFAIAGVLGIEIVGNAMLVVLVLAAMAMFYIGLGMILGSLLGVAPLSGAYSAVLLLTIFAGAWFDLDHIGGPVQRVENVLPFTHALDAARAVMTDGAGLDAIATDLYWIVAYTMLTAALAGLTFQRRMVE